jgi:hypothetical protein
MPEVDLDLGVRCREATEPFAALAAWSAANAPGSTALV